jgi:hypothetical protein
VPDTSDAWHREIRDGLVRLQVQFENLSRDFQDLEREVKELKQERRESRKWAVPVGISIITLLVLVISNTLTLVLG